MSPDQAGQKQYRNVKFLSYGVNNGSLALVVTCTLLEGADEILRFFGIFK
jgi:hypothetical protein